MEKHIQFTKPNGEVITKHIRAKDEAELNKKIDLIQSELNKAPLLSKMIDEWQQYHDEEINYNTQQCYLNLMNKCNIQGKEFR